jgi:DNA repair exonuclease SbcCD ATPase subunit
MKEEKERLEKVRLEALNQIRTILPSIKSLEEELEQLRETHSVYKEVYEKADRTLAELDGRLKVIPKGKRGGHPKLSLEQIERIAKKLGVRL